MAGETEASASGEASQQDDAAGRRDSTSSGVVDAGMSLLNLGFQAPSAIFDTGVEAVHSISSGAADAGSSIGQAAGSAVHMAGTAVSTVAHAAENTISTAFSKAGSVLGAVKEEGEACAADPVGTLKEAQATAHEAQSELQSAVGQVESNPVAAQALGAAGVDPSQITDAVQNPQSIASQLPGTTTQQLAVGGAVAGVVGLGAVGLAAHEGVLPGQSNFPGMLPGQVLEAGAAIPQFTTGATEHLNAVGQGDIAKDLNDLFASSPLMSMSGPLAGASSTQQTDDAARLTLYNGWSTTQPTAPAPQPQSAPQPPVPPQPQSAPQSQATTATTFRPPQPPSAPQSQATTATTFQPPQTQTSSSAEPHGAAKAAPGATLDGTLQRKLSTTKTQAAFGQVLANRKIIAEKDQTLGKLEQLKVETMQDMVEQITYTIGDTTTTCNFLYLSNDQVSKIKPENMGKIRDKLGVKEPSMVIRLMPSRFGSVYWKTVPFWSGRFPAKRVPELSEFDRELTEHQMLLLCKEIILPLAMTTKALVIGSESCSLTAAFIKVSFAVQRQLGDICPFTIVIFARAPWFDVKARDRGSVVSNFRTKNWAKTDFTKAMAGRFGSDEAYWPSEDLSEGRYSLVMFECVDQRGNISTEIANHFQNQFVTALNSIPVLALITYGTEKMDFIPSMADHVRRGGNLMLIDSRVRENPDNPPDDISLAKDELMKFAEQLQQDGVVDWYTTSAMAFLKSVIDKKRHGALSATHPEKEQSQMWIWEACEALAERKQPSGAKKLSLVDTTVRDPAAAEAAQAEADLTQATDLLLSYSGQQLEAEMRTRQERFLQIMGEIRQTADWDAFKKAVETDRNWQGIRGCIFHSYQKVHEFCAFHPWAELKDKKVNHMNGRKQMIIHPPPDPHDKSLDQAKEELVRLFESEYAIAKAYDQTKLSERSFVQNQDLWLACYDILSQDKNVKTGSLHNLSKCKRGLNALAQIDYLPTDNTIEACVLLRRGWTLCDVFNWHATRYKYLSKASYMAMLVIGVIMVSVACITPLTDNYLCEQKYQVDGDSHCAESILPDDWQSHEQKILLLLALIGSLITGANTIVEPTRKWLGLRGAALQLESEIWKFRTRMGDYRSDSSSTVVREEAEQVARARFQEVLGKVQEKVQQGAGLKKTSFYSVATTAPDVAKEFEDMAATGALVSTTSSGIKRAGRSATRLATTFMRTPPHLREASKFVKHGQYEFGVFKESPPPGVDNHHSPCGPDNFIKWRLVTSRDYYQGKIPRYARQRAIFQGLLLSLSILSAIMAALSDPTWTAILAAIAGLVAAWQEFTGIEQKLDRYSTVANALENVLLDWQSLPETEQSVSKNIARMVLMTEGLIGGEHAAWMSDAQQAVRSQQRNKEKESGGDSSASKDKTA